MALVFFISFIVVLFDFRRALPEVVIQGITWLQFVPSLLKFFTLFTVGTTGFLVVVVLTLVFGRVYCSVVCPLGILQDVITRIRGWFGRKKKIRHKYGKPHNFWRYGFLGLAVISLAFGLITFINILDPYSNFSRFVTFFGKPPLILANNFLAGMLSKINIFTLFTVEPRMVPWGVASFQLGFLLLLIWMAAFHGRLYCNTICPVGTFLGFLSGFSLFRIQIDQGSCTHCGLCSVACKSSCIDVKTQTVDLSRCVTCFNCLPVCSTDSIVYRLPEKSVSRKLKTTPITIDRGKTDIGKRKLLFGLMAFLLGAGSIFRYGKASAATPGFMKVQKNPPGEKKEPDEEVEKKIPVATKPSTIPEKKEHAVSPPGSKGLDLFNDRCTACSLCINACPTDVLQPATLQYGLQGFMQPRMDYHSGFCNYECTRCMNVCPTGAILPEPLEQKKLIQMGVAHFEKDNCIVKTEGTDCGACSEHCPTKAVHMVPYEENLVIPEVNEDICIGCGACEFACPTNPYKAIYVNGNPLHKIAEKPKEEEIKPVNPEEDFPF